MDAERIMNATGEDVQVIPYVVYESESAKHERTVTRFIIALAISVALIFISNMAWLAFFNSYDVANITATQETTDGGHANFIGADGNIDNGEPENSNTNQN